MSGAKAIVKGLADDGGLFVPETFPPVTREELEEMLPMSYPERAAKVLKNTSTNTTARSFCPRWIRRTPNSKATPLRS